MFPYLASNAAVPLAAVILGEMPSGEPQSVSWTSLSLFGHEYDLSQAFLIQALAFGIFLVSLLPLIFGGKIYSALKAVMTFKIITVFGFLLFIAVCFSTFPTWRKIGTGFFKFGTVPIQGGTDAVDNVFLSLWRGDGVPSVDFSTIAMLAAFAAIAGQGGLSNAPLSNYTRDQGWGMGYHVGAIPSVIGGRNIALSHVGMVFEPTEQSLPRWRRWYRHVMRDQLVIWLPACFIGLALPSMLSVQFLPRGKVANDWTVAGMTAGGVSQHINTEWGPAAGGLFWYLTLLCGFLVLAPTMASTIDGIVRRWVNVFWTSSARLREWETKKIRNLYFYVLSGYSLFGMVMLYLGKPLTLLTIGTNIMNFALGFSCWHVLVLNLTLLPRELRPNWFVRIALFFAGLFFIVLSIIVAVHTFDKYRKGEL